MVPLGISSAAAVRVGQAIGRRDLPGARHAGNTAILLGATFMSFMSVVLLVFPQYIARIYTDNPVLIPPPLSCSSPPVPPFSSSTASKPLHRRSPRHRRHAHADDLPLLRLLAHRPPLRRLALFPPTLGVLGLWIGLSASLILIGILLLTFWRRRLRHLPI